MKTMFVLLLAACAAATTPTLAADARKGVSIEGKLNCPVISTEGGRIYLHLVIHATPIASSMRRPMNLAVVLDRSGSMGDQGKMEYARKALNSLIDQLREGDIFSLVIYDDVVEVLHRAQRVGSTERLKGLVERVSPRGSTNLGGGMVEGFRQVERHAGREFANRVILLSDGLANQGVTDPHELNRIARRYRGKSISLTTIGMGLDYNENLMVGLSESGGGSYYFIENPRTLASIMREEFNQLSTVVAQNATIELLPGQGVRLIDVIGYEHKAEGDRLVIPIGDLASGDRQELTVEVDIPEGSGSITAVRGTLRYEGKGLFESFPSFAATVRYSGDVTVIEKNRDNEVQAKADIARSTRNVEQAMHAMDRGDMDEAAGELKAAETMIATSIANAPAGAGAEFLLQQRSRLEQYQHILKDSVNDARRAKKAIQYENYRMLRNKQ
ncbi:MAG: VWA domain-containing protein [Bacteroidota bacterium]